MRGAGCDRPGRFDASSAGPRRRRRADGAGGQSRPAPQVWRLSGDPVADDQGFRLARLGSVVQHAGGTVSLAAFVALVAPADDPAPAAPAAGQLHVVDSQGGRWAAEYHEVLGAQA